jgi:PAS domain S-box-containing protein
MPSPIAARGVFGADLGGGILEASVDCIKVLGLDGTLHSMNEKGHLVMEIDDFGDMVGLPWVNLWSTEQRPAVEEALAAARGGRTGHFAGYRPTAKGTPKWWDVVVSPVRDAAGTPTHLVAISRDMTTDRHQVEAGDLLNLELGHRVRNLFALVNGMITMSARADPAVQPFAATLRERFTSLGRALDYIIPVRKAAGPSPNHTLKGLLSALLSPYATVRLDKPRFVIAGDDVPVGSYATTSLALSIHELATNSVKYGALINAGGQVTITIRRTPEGDCELAWVERGGPALDEPPTRIGFGSQVLRRSITGPLGGTITRHWRRDGLDLRLLLPVATLAH